MRRPHQPRLKAGSPRIPTAAGVQVPQSRTSIASTLLGEWPGTQASSLVRIPRMELRP